MEPLLFTDLFSPRPDQWGLRGDPHLWDELSTYLAEVAMPNSADAVRQTIANAIEILTGTALGGTDVVVVDRYPNDGMSGRRVSLRYWNETTLPLLVSRFRTWMDVPISEARLKRLRDAGDVSTDSPD